VKPEPDDPRDRDTDSDEDMGNDSMLRATGNGTEPAAGSQRQEEARREY
jgi:hypothetical protein